MASVASSKQFAVLYEQAADGGVGAYVPDLPGCFSVGATREEAERNIKDAIALYLEELHASGQPTPEPRTKIGYVESAA